MPRPSVHRSLVLSPAEARHVALLRRLPPRVTQLVYDLTNEVAWANGVLSPDPDPSPGATETPDDAPPDATPDTA